MKGRFVDLEQIRANFRKMAGENGLAAEKLSIIANSRYAQELEVWAKEKGKGDLFHKEAFHAYYGEGKNIGNIDVLKEIVKKSGLPEDEVITALKTNKYSEAVDLDWKESEKRELVAAPTFFIGDARLVGAQPYEKLIKFITENGAVKI
jgi:predicted DsbA family dithiol-disulfide isomerase